MAIIARKRYTLRSPLRALLNSAVSWQNNSSVVIGRINMTLQPMSMSAAAYDSLTAQQFGGNYIAMTLKPFRWSITAGEEVFGEIVIPQGRHVGGHYYLYPWMNLTQSSSGHVSALGQITMPYATPANYPIALRDRKLLLSAIGQVAGGQGDIAQTIGPLASSAHGVVSTTGDVGMVFNHVNRTLFMSLSGSTHHISEIIMAFPNGVSMSAAGNVTPAGAIDMTLRKASMSAAGYQSPEFGTITGHFATDSHGNLSLFHTLHAEQIFEGTMSTPMLDGPVMYSRGLVIFDGLGDMVFPNGISMSAAGWAEAEGSIAMTLRGITMAASSSEAPTGVVTTVLPPFTQALAGGPWVSGTIGSTFFNLTHSGSGNVTVSSASDMDDMIPQGRLTLTSATPFLITDAAGQGTVYYTPAVGVKIPIWGGTSFTATAFAEISQALTDTTKSPAAAAASSLYDLFVWDDAGTLTLSRGPAWSTTTSRGVGAGTTELDFVDGLWVNKQAITNGPGAGYGTYVGTIATDASATLNMMFEPTAVSGGCSCRLDVWNMYNRRDTISVNKDAAASWAVPTGGVWNALDSNTNNAITFVTGMAEDSITAYHSGEGDEASVTGALWCVGIGLDSSTTCLPGAAADSPAPGTGKWIGMNARADIVPQLGQHYLCPLQLSHSGGASLFGSGGTVQQSFRIKLRM